MRVRRTGALGILAMTATLMACSSPADLPRANPPPAQPSPAPPAPTSAASRQTGAEAERTLASLRTVDELPLFAMDYAGDYDAAHDVRTPPTATPFGCSLFVARAGAGVGGAPLFARNFDWEPHAALLLTTDPPDGYASMSVVDISYLGVGPDPTGDPRLLDAPLLPFDGMNERGLFVGLAADESATATGDPAKPTVGGVRVVRLALDEAATVDEALAVFARYNLDFGGGPALHYLIADASGASAVVEYVDRRMSVVRGGERGQVLTNIRLSGVDETTRRQDRRYGIAAAALDKGSLDPLGAMDVLRAVAQPHTRWSAVYEPATGSVSVVAGQRWQTVHRFSLGSR